MTDQPDQKNDNPASLHEILLLGDPRTVARALANEGPLLLVIDPRHPECHGWPASLATDAVVAIEILDPFDVENLHADDTFLPWTVVDDVGEVHWLTIPWAALLAAVGPLHRLGQPGQSPWVRLWTEQCDPQVFGSGPQAEAGLRALLAAAGLMTQPAGGDAAQTRQIEWSIQLSAPQLAADADRTGWCPDKHEALRQILSHPPHAAMLLLRDHPHLRLPGMERQPVLQIPVGSQPPRLDYRLDDAGIHLQIDQPPQHVGPGFVPWDAVGALQHPPTGRGWFWPADLPEPLQQSLTHHAADPEQLWQHALRVAGIPLAPTQVTAPPARLVRLGLPPAVQKRRAVQMMGSQGPVLVLVATQAPVEANVPWWQVPPGWQTLPVALLATGIPSIEPQLQVSREGVAVTMPDPDGQLMRVAVPWAAVFAVGAGAGSSGLFSWRDDLPRAITDAMGAIGDLGQGLAADLPTQHWTPTEAPLDALTPPFLGVGRLDSGEWVVTVVQALGPMEDDGTQPKLQAAFRIDGVGRVQ